MKKTLKKICSFALAAAMIASVPVAASASVPQDGWYYAKPDWYYYEDGQALTEWQNIDGEWYYLALNGAARMGWWQLEDDWYFFKEMTGEMVTGWFEWNGKTYYFDPSTGAALRDTSAYIDGVEYFFNKDSSCGNPLAALCK